MAAKLSQSLKDLEQDLLENGSEYNFFQAYHFLNKINEAYPVQPRKPKRRIDVRPDLNLGFAESDVSEVEALEKNQGFELTTQLPGLYGIASPLPDFYSEELLDNEWDDLEAPREFLDLIHNQLFPKLYRAWKLYKLNINTVEETQEDYYSLLYSLMGDPSAVADDQLKRLKFRFFNLFSQKQRSTEGVKVIIEDLLNLDELDVQEFVNKQLPIPESQRFHLGSQNHQLGDTAHLGCTISDRAHSVQIRTQILNTEQYLKLVNDQEGIEQVKALVSEYLNRPIDIKLIVRSRAGDQQLALGQSWNQLGVTSRLPDNNESVTEVSIELAA